MDGMQKQPLSGRTTMAASSASAFLSGAISSPRYTPTRFIELSSDLNLIYSSPVVKQAIEAKWSAILYDDESRRLAMAAIKAAQRVGEAQVELDGLIAQQKEQVENTTGKAFQQELVDLATTPTMLASDASQAAPAVVVNGAQQKINDLVKQVDSFGQEVDQFYADFEERAKKFEAEEFAQELVFLGKVFSQRRA